MTHKVLQDKANCIDWLRLSVIPIIVLFQLFHMIQIYDYKLLRPLNQVVLNKVSKERSNTKKSASGCWLAFV